MRITCVIGTLGGGGAERMMTYLCGGLAARGHTVTLLTLDNSVPDFYSLPDSVTRVRVQLPTFKAAGFLGGFTRLWKLTRAVCATRPQIIISFMTISVLACGLLLRIPYIYADHLDVRHLTYCRKWEILRNFLLRFAKAVTVLSQRDREFIAHYHPRWKPVVIYNPALPCPQTNAPRPSFFQPDKKYVLAVGRLVQQKGFDRLLQAWSHIGPQHPSWQLAIIGQGE
ncbi:MAG: glycosyltransferase, partial [Elusimicrobiaceae bacterium]|nr:glycosyltransferase [Elusimicrobiaceae bacterium]